MISAREVSVERPDHLTAEQIPADRKLVEHLYAHKKITSGARQYALNLLAPPDQWGIWISRFLLALGLIFILVGIVCFFAFNWARIPPAIKLLSIQLAMIGCLTGVWFYRLDHLNGQVLLLSASVLVGVFMAVFGQIYQTGADSYTLFMMWSLLIFGWTLISHFAAQWVLWLVITNIFLVLCWAQLAAPIYPAGFLIFSFIGIFNGCALLLREYFVIQKKCQWLAAKWTRMILIIATLAPMVWSIIPILEITSIGGTPISTMVAMIMSLFVHSLAYSIYRYRLPDIISLALTLLFISIIIHLIILKFLSETTENKEAILLMGMLILGVFTCVIRHLRHIARKMETCHV